MSQPFAASLIKTLWILRDYLSEIVVGGGWAPMLYHRYVAMIRWQDHIKRNFPCGPLVMEISIV